jgi:non-specific serine/threonine protein kinase
MLQTIREYAAEQLRAHDELQQIRRRHAEYYVEFVGHARRHLRGPDARVWFDRLGCDHDNLRSVVEWGETTWQRSQGSGDAAESALALDLIARLVEAAAFFWMVRGHLRYARDCVDRLVARAPRGTETRARSLVRASALTRYMGDHSVALRLGEEGLALWRAIGDQRQIAIALARVADAAGRLGELDRARALLDDSVALSGDGRCLTELEHPIVITRASAAWVCGDLESAQSLFEHGLALGRADGDPHTTFLSLRFLGLLAHRRGDPVYGQALFAESLRLAYQLDDDP